VEWEGKYKTRKSRDKYLVCSAIEYFYHVDEILECDESECHEEGKEEKVASRKSKLTGREADTREMLHSLFDTGCDEKTSETRE
jgi:hypothetical protein